ncbi:hypothetical protein TNCV_331021 [Trichonephila clavipes]|nr:hypothetical protein TNCV_331021 [Trichonephila clavipes]
MAQWRVPLTYYWYVGNRPALAVALKCDSSSHTTLPNLVSVISNASRPQRTNRAKCQVHQPSTEYILSFMGLSRKDIYTDPLLVFHFL